MLHLWKITLFDSSLLLHSKLIFPFLTAWILCLSYIHILYKWKWAILLVDVVNFVTSKKLWHLWQVAEAKSPICYNFWLHHSCYAMWFGVSWDGQTMYLGWSNKRIIKAPQCCLRLLFQRVISSHQRGNGIQKQ